LNVKTISMYYITLNNTRLFMEAQFSCTCNGEGGPDLSSLAQMLNKLASTVSY